MKKYLLKILCFITILSVISLVCAQEVQDPTPENKKILTIIDDAHSYNLNPQTACYSTDAQILINLYEGLFSYDPSTLEPKKALATDYHISRNKKRWTFILRQGACFSNGKPITANVVKKSWLKLLSTPNAPYSSFLDVIQGAQDFREGKTTDPNTVGIEAINDTTLVVILNTPASHFPKLLCHHAFSVISDKDSLNVSSGAYVLAERNNNKIRLLKNPQYWDAANVKINEIDILQSDDMNEIAYDFNTGKADWATGSFLVNSILNQNDVKISAEFGTQYLFFGCANKPWNNEDFRNALVSAIPWKQIRDGYPVPATTLVYPLSNYPSVDGLNYTDPYEAADLMKDARKKANIASDKILDLTFSIPDSDYMNSVAELLKKAWKPLGVNLIIKKTPVTSYLDTIDIHSADLFTYTWIGDFADPLAFLELFRGNSTLSPCNWNNTEFDNLLKKAAEENEESKHLELLSQAENLLLDNGVVLPISHPVSLNAIDLTQIGGWNTNAFDIHPFKYFYFTNTKTEIPNIVKNTRIPDKYTVSMSFN